MAPLDRLRALWRDHGARLLRFGIVGVLNTGVDVALYAVLALGLGWHPVLANTASYAAGTVCSFVINRAWTFADRRGGAAAGRQFLRFLGVNLATLAIGNLAIALLLAFGAGPMAAKGVSVLLCFAINYALTRRFVFNAAAGPEPAR